MAGYLQAAALGVFAAMSLAGAALAQAERGPECGWDVATQRFVDGGAPAWVGLGGSPDFAATYIWGDARSWMILHHCPSDRYILIVARNSDADRVQERFNFLLETDTKYTMDQIGADLATLGAGVRRGQGDIGRCDCDVLASWAR